jgi:hypothetical protein
LENLIHAIEQGQASKGNDSEEDNCNSKSLPCFRALENTPISLVKHPHDHSIHWLQMKLMLLKNQIIEETQSRSI